MTGLSYEFPFGFSIDARYLWGVSDAMTTENNTYRFVENSNHTGCVEVTVGYAYSYGENHHTGEDEKGRDNLYNIAESVIVSASNVNQCLERRSGPLASRYGRASSKWESHAGFVDRLQRYPSDR